MFLLVLCLFFFSLFLTENEILSGRDVSSVYSMLASPSALLFAFLPFYLPVLENTWLLETCCLPGEDLRYRFKNLIS